MLHVTMAAENQLAEKMQWNEYILNDEKDGKKITPYTWIYRWESENEFKITMNDKELHILPITLTINPTKNTHKYLKSITDIRPYICIYHKAGPSKMKNCSDVDHFHMISWHNDHLTCEYGFGALKKALNERG